MATITAVHNTYASVNTAVNTTAARGDTVIIPDEDDVSWGASTLTITKGITLKTLTGRDEFVITGTATPIIAITPDATAVTNEELIKISGLTLNGGHTTPGTGSLQLIAITGAGASGTKPFKNLAIGDCKFTNTATATSGAGAITGSGQFRGAIYNNLFIDCNVILKLDGNNTDADGIPTEWMNAAYVPFSYGSSDQLYFEDNTITWTQGGYADPGWTETGQGARLCCRYNSWNYANSSAPGGTETWDIHGFQNYNTGDPSDGQSGTMVSEYYGNTVANHPNYGRVNHRGSWALIYNNLFTPLSTGNNIELNQYNDSDSHSGCCGKVPTQVDGSGNLVVPACGIFRTEVNNTYVFNNLKNGAQINMTSTGSPGAGCGVAENSHYWNYNSAFNGSTGIGRGSGTPTGISGVNEGVGYWQSANSGAPTIDKTINQGGVFWRFHSGEWQQYYTPYQYPHPLSSVLSISGKVTYGVNGYPVPGVTLTVSGDASTTATTDSNGNYLITSLTSGGSYVVTPSKATLAAGTHGIDTGDVVSIQKHTLGFQQLTGWAKTSADVDLSGTIQTADALAVSSFYRTHGSGYSNTGQHKFSATSTTYTAITTNQTGKNHTCYVLGDTVPPHVYATSPSSPGEFKNSGNPALTGTFKLVSPDYVAPVDTFVQLDDVAPSAPSDYDNDLAVARQLSMPTSLPLIFEGIVASNGQSILLKLSKPLFAPNNDAGEVFLISISGGSNVIASYLAGSGTTTYTLFMIDDTAGAGQQIRLSYASTTLHDGDGNLLPAYTNMVIDNQSTQIV